MFIINLYQIHSGKIRSIIYHTKEDFMEGMRYFGGVLGLEEIYMETPLEVRETPDNFACFKEDDDEE